MCRPPNAAPLTGVTVEQARAFVALLNLLLALPAIDVDTGRRASWLKMRLCELLPDSEHDVIDDAKAQLLLDAPARAIAA
jgi:hypothetical protein